MREDDSLFEMKRKLVHIIIGSILTALLFFGILESWMLLVIILVGAIFSLLYKKYDIPILSWFLKNFEREEYLKSFPAKGLLSILLSALILNSLATKEITAASLMIWTFGDSMTAIIGKYYGKIKHPFNGKRLIEGTMIGILMATIASAPFVGFVPALIVSLITMSIESLEVKFRTHVIEDNLMVPLLSGFLLSILVYLM